jgi:hypothetical protein
MCLPFRIPVTPMTRSWNEFSVFIEVWEGLRRLAELDHRVEAQSILDNPKPR